jgi:phage tail tape-measure protein
VTAKAPRRRRFGTRGQRLWTAYEMLVDGERGLVLLEEAARIADRLDKLDGLLRGDITTWARLTENHAGDLMILVDSPLVEARQQANVLRQILGQLPLKGVKTDDDNDRWLDDLPS